MERDRVEGMLNEHHADFQLRERAPIRERLSLHRRALLNLLRGTYRGARLQAVRSGQRDRADGSDVEFGVVCVEAKVINAQPPTPKYPTLGIGDWGVGELTCGSAFDEARATCVF